MKLCYLFCLCCYCFSKETKNIQSDIKHTIFIRMTDNYIATCNKKKIYNMLVENRIIMYIKNSFKATVTSSFYL